MAEQAPDYPCNWPGCAKRTHRFFTGTTLGRVVKWWFCAEHEYAGERWVREMQNG